MDFVVLRRPGDLVHCDLVGTLISRVCQSFDKNGDVVVSFRLCCFQQLSNTLPPPPKKNPPSPHQYGLNTGQCCHSDSESETDTPLGVARPIAPF